MNVIGKTLLITGALCAVTAGQTSQAWKIDANTNLTTAVNSYSDNWVSGEAGSFTWASQFLGVAEKLFSSEINTKTTLNLQFGQTEVQDKTTKQWGSPQKSTDLIDGEELLRYITNSWVDPFVSVRAIGEFVDGSDTLLKRYFNPFNITEALGVSRTIVKNTSTEWSTRIGGAARQVVDRQHLDTSTGERKTDVTNDGGFELNMNLKAENKAKWASLLSSLRVYEAVVSSKADAFKGTDQENYWRFPHVQWENTFVLTFAKYLMLNVSAYVMYDKDINVNVRLKETFSAGLTYMYSKK